MKRLAGRYRLDQVVGVGGFATVHRAHDEQLDDTVAIKMLAENHSLNPDLRQRFVVEGQVLRRVRSNHVVRVYDLAETPDRRPYLVLEFGDRGTLAERVTELREKGWAPTVADLLAVATSLAQAIQALADIDVVHRDLSPHNLLLRSGQQQTHPPGVTILATDERLLLTDLGFVKDLAASTGLTAAGGTAGFRPPEQQQPGATVDVRSDLWAASAILSWLAAPRPVSTPREGAKALTQAGLPHDVANAATVGLATAPDKRPSSPAAWLAAIEAAADPAASAQSGTETITSASGPRRQAHRGWWVSLALGLSVLLVSGGLWWQTQGPQVTELGRGQTRTSQTAGEVEVAIIGPSEIPVGTAATFTAEVAGTDQWVWLTPDGQLVNGVDAVEIQANSAGQLSLVLLGAGPASQAPSVDVTVTAVQP